MATHSSVLAWRIPGMGQPGGLLSMGSQRVGHDSVTSLSHTGEGNGNPLQCSCLENPRDGGAWWAAVYGVAKSRTQLKRLSSSSSSNQAWGMSHFLSRETQWPEMPNCRKAIDDFYKKTYWESALSPPLWGEKGAPKF